MSKRIFCDSQLKQKIQRYVFRYIDSNMYILVEDHEAIVIDPHIDEEADAYLKQYSVDSVTILLTHEHFDHTCGIPWFRQHYDTTVICQERALDLHSQRITGRSISISLVLSDQGRDDEIKELEREYPPFTFTAETTFDNELDFIWHDHNIHMEHIPGHSPASTLITIDERNVFTGDSLVPDCETTLRWPGSDAKVYEEKAVPALLSIPYGYMIYPGHREPIYRRELTYINYCWKKEIKQHEWKG